MALAPGLVQPCINVQLARLDNALQKTSAQAPACTHELGRKCLGYGHPACGSCWYQRGARVSKAGQRAPEIRGHSEYPDLSLQDPASSKAGCLFGLVLRVRTAMPVHP
jgi:hypothetical protein